MQWQKLVSHPMRRCHLGASSPFVYPGGRCGGRGGIAQTKGEREKEVNGARGVEERLDGQQDREGNGSKIDTFE